MRLLTAFLIILTVFIPSRGFSDNQASRYILDNGLTVIIKPVPVHPVVSVVCVVKAGSATEGRFSGSGISHFIEHLLFKGTAKRGVGEIARQIKQSRGKISAYTTLDYTRYEITLPAEHLGRALDILSDVLANASFDSREMEKERNVILNEMRRGNDDNDRYLSKLLWSTAFREHPYRMPVIGYQELFLKLTRDDILEYYRQMYVPNNIILSVVGGIEAEQVLLKVKKAFKYLQRGRIMPYAVVCEPVQMSKREIVEGRDQGLAHLLIGFHGPELNSPDLYAMDVAAIILGEGRSSRLYTRLKEKEQIVHSISAFSYTPRDPGIFGIKVLLDREKIPEAVTAVEEELAEIKKGGINDQELDKARKMVLADYIFSLQTAEAQAGQLAVNQALTGDFNFSKRYIDGINSVTLDDIKRSTLKYFKPNNLTQAMLVPGTKEPSKMNGQEKTVDLPIKKIILNNGLTVLLKENHATPAVSIRAVIKGGVRLEEQASNGISLFTAKMLLKGTKKRSSEDIFEELASIGAKVSSYSGNNSFGVSLDVLSGDLETAIDVLMDAFINSAFDQPAIEKVREEMTARIEEKKEDSFDTARQALKSGLFKTHPYQFEVTGTRESLSNIGREDLLEFYDRYVLAGNMVIAVFGDIDPEETERILTKKSKGLKRKPADEISIPAEKTRTRQERIEKYMDKSEATVLAGFHTIAIADNDRYVFEVITAVLSGQDGRLFRVIREDLGLSYVVGSYHVMGLDPGYYVLHSASEPKEIGRVRDLLISQIELLRTEPVGAGELKRAKNALIGSWIINLQSNAALAFSSGLDELYGLGYNNYKHYPERIGKITAENITRTANRYLDPEKSVIVTITAMNEKYTAKEKQYLLDLARRTISSYLKDGAMLKIEKKEVPEDLREKRACFVTLTKKQGGLRGCMGLFGARTELYKNVMDRAVAAAVRDPRFPCLACDELKKVRIEISVLTPPEELSFETPEDLLGKLRPGKDGVVIYTRYGASTYLPQVWEQIPDKEMFLSHLCSKQGAPSDYWRTNYKDVRIEIYQAIVFGEKIEKTGEGL
ncbi:MAG: AmmeMemoRadiSam system protein A [Candidatus Omnitrophota bacterium]|nr:AmmeMemoRadiSam system protein A [Candidatus Omnitrophota bacterium]